jgi:hypothetical protein
MTRHRESVPILRYVSGLSPERDLACVRFLCEALGQAMDTFRMSCT